MVEDRWRTAVVCSFRTLEPHATSHAPQPVACVPGRQTALMLSREPSCLASYFSQGRHGGERAKISERPGNGASKTLQASAGIADFMDTAVPRSLRYLRALMHLHVEFVAANEAVPQRRMRRPGDTEGLNHLSDKCGILEKIFPQRQNDHGFSL